MMSNAFILPSYFGTPIPTEIAASRYDSKGRQLSFVETEVQRLERMALVNASKARNSSPNERIHSPSPVSPFLDVYIYTCLQYIRSHSREWRMFLLRNFCSMIPRICRTKYRSFTPLRTYSSFQPHANRLPAHLTSRPTTNASDVPYLPYVKKTKKKKGEHSRHIPSSSI